MKQDSWRAGKNSWPEGCGARGWGGEQHSAVRQRRGVRFFRHRGATGRAGAAAPSPRPTPSPGHERQRTRVI